MMDSCNYSSARRKLTLFLLLVAVFSAAIATLQMLVPPGTRLFINWSPASADICKMWSVGLAGLIALLAVDRSLRDLGRHFCDLRYFGVAALVPLIYGLAIYVPVWMLGIGEYRGQFLMRLLMACLHLPMSMLFAAGEEIGWRGVLVPNLARTSGFATTTLLPGAIWALWHWPDIVFFGYNAGTPTAYALSCFSISLIGFGVFLSWLRLASNSVWPAVLYHGVHNTLIGGVFDRSTVSGSLTNYITTEFGFGMSAAAIAVGFLFWGKRAQADRAIAALRQSALDETGRSGGRLG
jgi:uncharacterized protein